MMALERAWIGLVNSDRVRRLRGSPAVERLLSTRIMEGTDRRRRRLVARLEARRHPGRFDDLQTVCLFIGHVKSGGSLLGAMIDAHPDAVIADEVDVLDQLSGGLGREELLAVLVRNARREALKGRVTARRLGGYSLAIPDQWQGRHRVLRVIGETRAGPTTRRLGEERDRLELLRSFARPAELKFIHVVRNPLDPIGAMVTRGRRSVEDACADYDAQATRVERIQSWLAPDEMIAVRYEDLVAAPGSTMSAVLDHLGLEHVPTHMTASVDLIHGDRRGERTAVDWSPSRLDMVRRLVEAHAFLAPYRDSIEVATGSIGP